MELKRAGSMLRYVVFALAIGLVGAMLKLVYSYAPGANLVDVLVFMAVGHLVSRVRPERRWTMAAAAALPALALVTWILIDIEPEEVRHGVGDAWLRSAVIIPLAALLGATIRLPWERKKKEL